MVAAACVTAVVDVSVTVVRPLTPQRLQICISPFFSVSSGSDLTQLENG